MVRVRTRGIPISRRGFLLLWTGMSLVFLAFGGYLVYQQNVALETYEPTEATVVGTEVIRTDPADPDESPTYEPVVRYRYSVDGEQHTSGNVFPGGTPARGDRGWAREIVSEYDTGQRVTVYYDPADPGSAYLLKQRDLMKWAFVLFPLLCLGVGVFALARE